MTSLIEKMIVKVLSLIIILSIVLGLQELILTDEHISFSFEELMGILPFAQMIAEAVCGILKCQNELPIPNTSSVMLDLIRLAIMACLQPCIVGFFTRIFLPLPSRSYEVNERYMESLGYKIKELIINVLTIPIIALISSYIAKCGLDYLTSIIGNAGTVIIGTLSALGLSALSLIPLVKHGIILATAILWRLFVTLGAKMFTTFITNMLCIAIYIAIMGGIEREIFVTIVTMIIWMIIMDFGMNCLQKAIVG